MQGNQSTRAKDRSNKCYRAVGGAVKSKPCGPCGSARQFLEHRGRLQHAFAVGMEERHDLGLPQTADRPLISETMSATVPPDARCQALKLKATGEVRSRDAAMSCNIRGARKPDSDRLSG